MNIQLSQEDYKNIAEHVTKIILENQGSAAFREGYLAESEARGKLFCERFLQQTPIEDVFSAELRRALAEKEQQFTAKTAAILAEKLQDDVYRKILRDRVSDALDGILQVMADR